MQEPVPGPARLRSALDRISPLDDAAWQALASIAGGHRFQSGELLLRAGDTPRTLLFLTDGLVRFFYLREDGREFNKSFVAAPSAMGSLLSLVHHEPSPFSIQALSAGEAWTVDYAQFCDIADANTTCARLGRRLLEALALKKERREADFLLLDATQRYRRFLLELGDWAERVPNYQIAAYLGITDVALSRIRRRLRESG